jgi:hypothetical protein
MASNNLGLAIKTGFTAWTVGLSSLHQPPASLFPASVDQHRNDIIVTTTHRHLSRRTSRAAYVSKSPRMHGIGRAIDGHRSCPVRPPWPIEDSTPSTTKNNFSQQLGRQVKLHYLDETLIQASIHVTSRGAHFPANRRALVGKH